MWTGRQTSLVKPSGSEVLRKVPSVLVNYVSLSAPLDPLPSLFARLLSPFYTPMDFTDSSLDSPLINTLTYTHPPPFPHTDTHKHTPRMNPSLILFQMHSLTHICLHADKRSFYCGALALANAKLSLFQWGSWDCVENILSHSVTLGCCWSSRTWRLRERYWISRGSPCLVM